ncbi:MAG: flagellar hook protein FlgE [Gammaproteobacteria bacterium]|nr:flagellar hook protein FlgE [Gammaproteobacteria bacterium]
MPFRIALSGINSFSTSLRSTGNNIANAGSTGFKQSRTEFSDIYASSTGNGVKVAAVENQFTQGNIVFTNNTLDMAVNGQGFFRLEDNGATIFSRAGNFRQDQDGYIVNKQNQHLTGFQTDAGGNVTGSLGPLQLDASGIQPDATTRIDMGMNLDASGVIPTAPFDPNNADSYNAATTVTVYDSQGSEQDLSLYFQKTADNTFDVYGYSDGNQVLAASSIQFDSNGNITDPASPSTINIPAFNPGSGAADMNIMLGVADVTQYSSDFSVNSITQDGFGTGQPSSYDISDTGMVSARFTNGQSRVLGQVALANFSSPQGLTQLGNTSFVDSYDSGAPLIGAPGSGSLGLVQSGVLEMSNTDLAESLINLKMNSYQLQAQVRVIEAADKTIGSLFDATA